MKLFKILKRVLYSNNYSNFKYVISPSLLHNLKSNYCTTTNYNLNLKIKNISLNNYIKTLENEYNKLNKLSDSVKNPKLIKLEPIINVLGQRQEIIGNINNLKELLTDNDESIKKLAKDERSLYEQQIETLNEQLFDLIVASERDKDEDCNSIVLEVNSGVGGQEAMLFAKELFEMYCSFSQYKGWQLEVADYSVTDLGGVRHASALITGDLVFQHFQYEAGVHRVQRVPVTEKSGRIHTSTVSVVALPQPDDIEINLDNKDLRIETKKASGAGGQHVNTTDSAVRITHLPTGLFVECQVDRSQLKNKRIALIKLKALLYQKQLESQMATTEATRKSQVRTNFRNEKIRTYNFSQDRVSDHRLQGVNLHNLKGFLEGGQELDGLISQLHSHTTEEKLYEIVNKVDRK